MTENSPAETPERPSWLPARPYDWPEIVQRLTEIVASKPPGHCYVRATGATGCSYWHSDTEEPGCIVGVLMYKLGVPVETLKMCDSSSKGGTIGNTAQYLIQGLFDDRTVAVL